MCLIDKLCKKVDNKSKTSLIRHIQKRYITQCNTRAAHSNNIVIFICDFFLCMSFGKLSYYILKCIVIVVFVTVVEDCIMFGKISIVVG